MENLWLKNKKKWVTPFLTYLTKEEVDDKLKINDESDEIRNRIMENRWIINYFKTS